MSLMQLKALADKVREFMRQNINKENLMSVGNLIKGFTIDDIRTFSAEAFK